MNHYPTDLNALLDFALSGEIYQQFVDRYEEKYDGEIIDGFKKVQPQLDYTYAQLIASTGANTLPAYVDPESPGYEGVMREMEGATGNIPTMKKFYRMNRVQLNRRLQLIQRYGNAALDAEMRSALLGLLDEGTDGLIGGYYNALTHQRMQIVSTGQFTIDSVNNPRGLQGITLKFHIADNHFDKLEGAARWWTDAARTKEGTASDPVKDMKNWVKEVRRVHHYLGPIHIEMAQDLYDDLLLHSKVVAQIGLSVYGASISDAETRIASASALLDDEAKGRVLTKLVGLTIIPRDTFGFVAKPITADDGNPDIVEEAIENFRVNNVSIVPDGDFGEIQAVTPLTLGYEPNKVARFDGGRLILSQRAVPTTHSIYIDSEAAPLCVPTVPQGIFIHTVCPHADGK